MQQDQKKVETSELLRVFGTISASPETTLQCDAIQHDATVENELPVAAMQQKIAMLEQLLESKNKEIQRQDDHIDSLKKAMLLIESKLPATPEPVTQPVVKKSWLFWKK